MAGNRRHEHARFLFRRGDGIPAEVDSAPDMLSRGRRAIGLDAYFDPVHRRGIVRALVGDLEDATPDMRGSVLVGLRIVGNVFSAARIVFEIVQLHPFERSGSRGGLLLHEQGGLDGPRTTGRCGAGNQRRILVQRRCVRRVRRLSCVVQEFVLAGKRKRVTLIDLRRNVVRILGQGDAVSLGERSKFEVGSGKLLEDLPTGADVGRAVDGHHGLLKLKPPLGLMYATNC